MNSKKMIADFHMLPHQEGGYYAELWQSPKKTGNRCLSSHIYYLLPHGEPNQWHRLTSDEIWLFHQGEPLTIRLGGCGEAPEIQEEFLIGKDLFHLLIPAGTWQSAKADKGDALVSCIVSPGYHENDCELYGGEK